MYTWRKRVSDRYDIIIGRDLMRELGLKLNFNDDVIECGELQIPMNDMDALPQEELKFATGIKEPTLAAEAVERVSKILDAKYAPVSPKQVLENSPHLTADQKALLKVVLEKHAKLFDGTLGKWKGVQQHIELKDRISFEGVSRSTSTCAVVGDKMTIFLRSAGGLFCHSNIDVSVKLKSVCGILGNKCCGTCCIPDK